MKPHTPNREDLSLLKWRTTENPQQEFAVKRNIIQSMPTDFLLAMLKYSLGKALRGCTKLADGNTNYEKKIKMGLR